MSGFGREAGPSGQLNGQSPFVHNPRTPSPHPSTSPSLDFSGAPPRFPHRTSPLPSTPPSLDFSSAPRFPQVRSPPPSTSRSTNFSGAPRFSSPSHRTFEAVGRTPSPGSSLPFAASNRTFETVVRSPSTVATPNLAPGSSQPYVATNRQSSVTGGFGDLSQRSSFPNNRGTSISSKVLPSQDPESFRRPRVQYDDDFLGDPVNDAMGGHADFTLNRHVVSQRRQSPTSDVARNHSVINPAASSGKSQRASISPPKSISKFGAVIDPKYSERMLSPNDGLHGDVRVTRLPNHSLTKRTRSPPAATGQVSLSSSPFTVNDAEREEQAKAKRLARFKTELNEVEPSVLVQRGPNVTHNKKNSLMNSMVTKNSMEELSQECDTEDLQSSNIIVGMCPDMCPESERGERERKGDLDRYERLDGDRNHTSKILAVKKYNRTAEREAELIRPMPILQKTMDYLLGLLDQPYDDRLLNLYNFLWDRMRAIRMDLRMQHIFNLKAITMLEQMIRLHVLAMHELCEFSRGEGFSEGFDAHLNIEQMNKTSVELFQLYDDHRKKGTPIPTEKEFRGYYALLKLDKHPGYKVEPAELSLDLAKMTAEIRQTQEILFARDVARSCRTGNFIAFFRHARKASYLQACLMHAHFSKLRTQALASLHSGLQYGQGVPVTHVAKWLGMEGEDIERLLEYHGFLMKEFEEPYMVKDGPFLHDDKDYPTRCSILVHRKKSDTIVEDVSSSHEIRSPTETKQFEKYSENKHTARQFVQTESPLNVSVGGDTGMEVELSPRGNFQGQTAFNGSRGTQVGLIPGSRKGQPFNDHQRVLTGSPRSKTGVPMTFSSVTSHVMQEEPSPLTPKGTLFISDDRQLNDEVSSRSFAADPLNLAPHTSSLGLAKQDEFKGPIQSSLNLIAHSDFNATPPLLVSEDVRESMSSDLEVAFVSATSPFNGVVMEELDEDKTDDVQEVENDDVGSNFDKEVAEAKLRLLLRLWRRRFVRKKKLYEENRLAANAALSSLSLGPPLWQSKEKPLHSRRLNIDKAVHERYEKWQESLIRWNVSDLVAAKLTEKNPVSNCVCWKVISFSWSHQETNDSKSRSSVANLSLDEWLRFKLIPPAKDETTEGLVMSAPGLSVWRKWTATNSRDTACYFSVIKDTTSGNSEINFVGASAILFPISETVSWNVQRAQLHNLVMSLPIEARIPLLVISGSRQVNLLQNSTDITDNLGLEELDRSRVGSYSIVCINDRDDTGQERHGYFSDPKMQDGLIWLASESRSQPILSWVTTRELVSLHLSSCLDALQHLGPDRVGPNQCISAFNEALDQSIKKIVTASKANPTGWPCPELFLLDESSAEFRAVKQCLPNLGWSTSEEVESLISALGSCKLPHFSEDLSWLGNGCNIEEELEEQRQLLQDCLIKYLTQTSNLMHWMMATNEANLMVQNYTRLELCDTEFQMVPNWVRIFRRVFNWQLNSSASFTKIAYVLEQSGFSCNLQSNMDVHMYPYSVHPSLDEMVEVSCSSPIVSKRVRSSPPKSLRNVAARTSGEKTDVVTLPSLAFEEQNKCSLIDCHSVDLDVDESNIHLVKGNLDLVTIDEKKDDRLIQLLNQCDILQDEIQKKLSIYY